MSIDTFLSQRDKIGGGGKGLSFEVPVAFSASVMNQLDIALWSNNFVVWDSKKGEWVPDDDGTEQAKLEGLSLRMSKPTLVDGDVAFQILSVTGASRCALRFPSVRLPRFLRLSASKYCGKRSPPH